MRIKNYVSLAAICLMAMGCQKKEADNSAGINLANLDTKVVPGNDFYNYACGGWIKEHPLKPEYARYGNFDVLSEKNREDVKIR